MSTSVREKSSIRQRALPITVEQYHSLGRAGLIAEKAELIDGVIVEPMRIPPLHSFLVGRLREWLHNALPAAFHVRQEQPLTFATSEPQPDLAVVAGDFEDYGDAHPTTAHLVIEVAIKSVEFDRDKADIYAAAGVPEYWLVIGESQRVEVYTNPVDGKYTAMCECAGADVLRPLFASELQLSARGLFQPTR